VLSAALGVFAEQGYAGFSMDEVAVRAGVNKTTVYRRWPSKAELVSAALFSLRDQDPEPPDTGSLRTDLVELLHARAGQMELPHRRAILQALVLSNTDPELHSVLQRLRRERPAIPQAIFERAAARGELPPETDGVLIAETLLGVLHTRSWKRERVSRHFLIRLVNLVVAGAEAGAAHVE